MCVAKWHVDEAGADEDAPNARRGAMVETDVLWYSIRPPGFLK